VQSQKKYPRAFSFEFYPPKTAQGKEKLRATWKQLGQLKPKFFSCTFGAGGSTREGTLETVLEIRAAGYEAAPHLSCIASSRAELKAQLEKYQAHGIRHIVALRGDLPSGLASSGELRYANELVAFIRDTTGNWFHIEVACYPEFHPQTRSAADADVASGTFPLVLFFQLQLKDMPYHAAWVMICVFSLEYAVLGAVAAALDGKGATA